MKQSEAYRQAIAKVIECTNVRTLDKVDILEVLYEDYKTAKWTEEQDAKKEEQDG